MGLVGDFFDGVQVLNEVLRVEILACEELLRQLPLHKINHDIK